MRVTLSWSEINVPRESLGVGTVRPIWLHVNKCILYLLSGDLCYIEFKKKKNLCTAFYRLLEKMWVAVAWVELVIAGRGRSRRHGGHRGQRRGWRCGGRRGQRRAWRRGMLI
jgi:hypothetical protein